MKPTIAACLLVGCLGLASFAGCDSDGSGGGIGAFEAGAGISIDNQGVISVEFGTEAGEAAAGNDPRFHQELTEADLQGYLDSHGYSPGAAYGDQDVQDYLDAQGYSPGPGYDDGDVQTYLDGQGYVAGPHVTSVEGLQGGTIQGSVTVTGDLTVNGQVHFSDQGMMIRRLNATLADELQSSAAPPGLGELVHSFAFTSQPDPLATGFVIDLEILHEPSGSGGATASFKLEDWLIGTANLSWGMGPEDPADTWIAKRITFTQNLPLTGTDHQIDVYLAYSYGGVPGPKVKVRNMNLRWYVAD